MKMRGSTLGVLLAALAAVALAVGPALAKTDGAPGTSHADALEGTAGADVLDAKAGHDWVEGKGGNDTLTGGPGRDLLDGGAGNDTIRARDGYRDAIYCGPGKDSVEADAKDIVSSTCERGKPKGPANNPGSLYISITSTNDGGGSVDLITEHPTHGLPSCGASECAYTSWPVPGTPTVLLSPDADLGSTIQMGGDCAGTTIPPCRLTMDSDKVVTVTFNGSG